MSVAANGLDLRRMTKISSSLGSAQTPLLAYRSTLTLPLPLRWTSFHILYWIKLIFTKSTLSTCLMQAWESSKRLLVSCDIVYPHKTIWGMNKSIPRMESTGIAYPP